MKTYKNNAIEREMLPLGRFELMCEKYIYGTEKERRIILNFFNEEEKKTFLQGCGLYHIFIDTDFYNTVRETVGKELYKELH